MSFRRNTFSTNHTQYGRTNLWLSLLGVTLWCHFHGFGFTYLCQPAREIYQFLQRSLFCLVYAIFNTSSMCYLLLSWCNLQAPSTFVTASWPLQSLFCAILSFIFLHKTLQLLEFFGGSLIVFGLAAVLWSKYTEEKELLLQLNEKNPAKGNVLPHKSDWKFSEAISEGYVVIPKNDDD